MMLGKRASYYTLGCKLNYAETSSIARKMEEQGFVTVGEDDPSDVYVINTCSVTDQADAKCRNIVRRALKKSPDAYVVVVGCYAQLKPKEIAAIKGVDLVLGASEKFKLPSMLKDLSKNPCGIVVSNAIDTVDFFVDSFSVGDRTRSFLKIQDGCDYKCSFCTIPLARGKSRSDTPENVLQNARLLAAKGVKEIVLTGVNTGDYGKGLEQSISFFDLIQQLDEVDGIERYRISSIEPNLLTEEIIAFVAQSKRFMPHFHVPLQSGSDKILSLMRRRYKRELYAERVEMIKKHMPHAGIGVDVIVGFPSESEEDFKETYHFIQNLDISYLHVFTYSERSNTQAIDIQEVVPVPVRNERNAMLRILSDKKKHAFYQSQMGQTRTVLWEAEQQGNLMEGYTDNYIRLSKPYDNVSVNKITRETIITI